ncbi:MAG: hypothetical protein ACYC9P_02640 [Rudaea sp.]
MQRELEARAAGDLGVAPAYRRFARLWLPHELEQQENERFTAENVGLAGEGAFVHENYTLLAHFLFLRRWIDAAERVQFSMDQEPLIDRACLLTFADRVCEGTLDAFYVRINKSFSVSKRRLALARAETVLAELREAHAGLSDPELVFHVMSQSYEHLCKTFPQEPRSRWVAHAYPTMQEPEREVLCLSDNGKRSHKQIVHGLCRATLRAIDRYFMQVRRKISVLERPLRTSSAQLHAWYGYNAYSPRVVMQVLEIFRVVYNFHLAGNDKRTPAQRLGLTERRTSLSELIAS